MDGDHAAKSMEQGANSAMKDQELTSGIHESVNQIVSSWSDSICLPQAYMKKPGAGEKTQGTGTSMFSKDGAVGKMFNGKPVSTFSTVLQAVIATCQVHSLTGFSPS